MSDSDTSAVGAAAQPVPLAWRPRGLVRFLYTSNPFYVISAALVLLGLWMSFNPQAQAYTVPVLTLSLAGYTALLAGTGVLLIRFGGVWQDVRTILLLVVLLFLATSVTIDETLVAWPSLGRLYFAAALVFAVGVTEGVLRGIGLRLPARFRVPYYLILSLFFVYPVALSPWLGAAGSRATQWGLFAFAPLAGLAFLTLIPAIRRGPAYVAENGSPWRWPLYPWVLFGFLALGVCGRAYYLCISLDMAPGFQSIFAPYFLVPFLLALAVLLLEAGLAARQNVVIGAALVLPFGLVCLATLGQRPDPVYQGFLASLQGSLGGSPLFLTFVALVLFQVYALVRGVRGAVETLSAALAGLVVVAPGSMDTRSLSGPQPVPLVALAFVQLMVWLVERSSWRIVVACACVAVSGTMAVGHTHGLSVPMQQVIVLHGLLVLLLLLGAVCDGPLGHLLRNLGAFALMAFGLAAELGAGWASHVLPLGLVRAYPLALGAVAVWYGRTLGHRPSFSAAIACAGECLVATVWDDYRALRRMVVGLDAIVLGLAFFVIATLISLAKGGVLAKWLARVPVKRPDGFE